MKKVIVFLLMILICFSSLSFATQKGNSEEKSNFNWAGLIFGIVCCGVLIAVVILIIGEADNHTQDVEEFNRGKRAARMNAHFKEEEIKKGG